MKMRWIILLLALCALAAGIAGCRVEKPEEQAGYVLYFAAGSGENHGPALGTEAYTGPLSVAGGVEPMPSELVQALLAGPASEDLRSPFPKGITLHRCEFDPDQPGHLKVHLSEQYGELTDISLTLADYAIVLTLTQLENVESVEIISGGYAANYRSHQILTAAEALLTDELAD